MIYSDRFEEIWNEAVREQPCKIDRPERAFSCFASIRNNKQESFMVCCLDGDNRVINTKQLTVGLLNRTLIHPREVFREAILKNSVAVILGHNHPSGNLTPSIDDKGITERLVEAGKLLGIPVLDHIIVSRRGYHSMKEHGEIL